MGKTVFLFAGQGAQKSGMGKDLYESDPVFRRIFDALDPRSSLNLRELCFETPQKALDRTASAQPALSAMELALAGTIESRGIHADLFAGLSLGEYVALAAAGAIVPADLCSITARRGRLMEEALPEGTGSMLAVLSRERACIEKICEQVRLTGHVCEPANINAPDQVILSGDYPGLAQAKTALKAAGIRKTVPLQVSGPFHSSLLKEASETLERILGEYAFRSPALPVVFNVSGRQEPVRSGDDVRALLVRQLYSPVQFDATLDTLLALGADTFIEIGPGRVLSRLVRRKAPQVRVFSVETAADLRDLEEAMQI